MAFHPFIKMHATQNDFILLDGFSASLPDSSADLATRLCSRRRHIGADGVLFLRPPTDADADVDVEIRNADGSTATMCGNGARCIAVWMKHRKRTGDTCRMRFSGRIVQAARIVLTETGGTATVNMGPAAVVTESQDAPRRFSDGRVRTVWHVDTGNPHAVVFSESLSDSVLSLAASDLSEHSAAADETNMELAVPTAARHMRVRVRERGCGETRSCGSGACAVLAAAIRSGIARPAERWHMEFPGGTLTVEQAPSGDFHLTGPADIVCTGRFAARHDRPYQNDVPARPETILPGTTKSA